MDLDIFKQPNQPSNSNQQLSGNPPTFTYQVQSQKTNGPQKPFKKFWWIFSILILIIVLVGGYFIYKNLSNKKKVAENENKQNENTDKNESKQKTEEIKEIQITKTSQNPYVPVPKIYEDKIVWEDFRNYESNGDIYSYDLSTQKETPISTAPNIQNYPDIYNNKIVYCDDRKNPNSNDIYVYDLNIKKETQITTAFGYKSKTKIFKDKIVWDDHRKNSGGIYIFNINTSKETLIAKGGSNPAIYDNRIIWVQSGINENKVMNGNDIFMHDLTTNKTVRVTHSPEIQKNELAIYKNIIVYNGSSVNNLNDINIYMYDLANNKETQISKISGKKNVPAIYENKVVWDNDDGSDSSLYLYDLNLKKESKILSSPGDQFYLDIYKDKVVWADDRNGKKDYDVYLADISSYSQNEKSSGLEVNKFIKLPLIIKEMSLNKYKIFIYKFGYKLIHI